MFDMEPARRLLGYEPRERWPEGLPFAVPELPRDPSGGPILPR
jgi:hypothetical protein